MKYFDYEKKISNEQLKKMSGLKSFDCGLSLVDFGIDFLENSITSENPNLNQEEFKKELQKILWSKR